MEQDDELKILIEATLDQAKSLQNILADLKQLQGRIKTFRLKIQAELDKDATSRQFKADLKQIANGKSKVKIVGEIDKAATQKNIKQQMGEIPNVKATADVNVNGGDEVDKLRTQMDNAGTSAAGMAAKIYVARSALQLLRRTAIEAKDTIVDLDAAATDLALATGSNADEAYALLEQYNVLAKRLGATTTQVADGAVEWLRQGKSAAETGTLIEQSMILSKVGAMSADDATKNLTSTMKGFRLEVEDVSGVVDKLTALDLQAAVTADDLATAVARTASSADLAGVGLDKLLGYITVVEETTQKSAETIGESFKTIFARMGNVKLGKFMDDDGEDLSDTEKILGKFGIALRKSNDQFRDFSDVLDEVASRWSEFTNVEQSAIATAIAGTRQRENFLVLMDNYGKALEYTGVAADSAGTAMEKFAAYEDSIQAKSASFVAAMEGLAMNTIDSDLVKDLIDAATAMVEFADAAGLLKAALLGIGTGAALKGIRAVATGVKDVSQNILNIGQASNILNRLGDASDLSAKKIQILGGLVKDLSDDQLKVVLSTKNLSAAQAQAILFASGLTAEQAAQKVQTLGLAGAQQTATGATWSLGTAMQGLKAAFLANPIGAIATAVSIATVGFSLLSSAMEAANQKAEENRNAMNEAAEAANNERKSLDELIARYRELANAGDWDSSTRESARQIQEDITDLVGEQADNLDLVNGKLDDQIAKLDEIRLANAKDNQGKLKTKKLDAEDQFNLGILAEGTETNWAENIAYATDIYNVLKEIGYINEAWKDASGNSNFNSFVHGKNAEEVLNAYRELQDVLLNNDGWQEHFDGLRDHFSQNLLNEIQSKIELYEGIIDDYQFAQKNFFENEAIIDLGETLKTTDFDSQEVFDSYIQGIRDSTEYSEAYKDALISLANETFPEFSGAAKQATEGADLSQYTAQVGKLTETISALQSSYDLLDTAQEDMSADGGLSPETIEKLAKAEENYLDYLYEENGVIKLNTEAWEENARAKMQSEVSEIQKEIDSLVERNKVLAETLETYKTNKYMSPGNTTAIEAWNKKIQETTDEINANTAAIEANQNKLNVYSILYGDITGNLDAYSAALANFSNVASAVDSVSKSFQTLADLQAEVSNGFTMSLDKALEFAAVYPEILNSATVAANGQITLNEDVVNSFIQGKKAEIDAQIDSKILELESRKAVLEAQMEFSKAELDLAKQVGEGEADIAKEVAVFRLDTANQLVAALIDAGVDEATAFQLACAAMAGNAEEFNRIAMEVCKDVNGNFNEAAYQSAQAVYQNMNSAKRDVASLATQAQQTAEAIAGMADGIKAGSSAVVGGSGGGTLGDGIKLNLSGADFKGTDYTYEAKEIGLDDFIFDLELDISNYENAIAQIDGQIAALQALKNAPLKSFKSGGTSGSSGGSGNKDVEEYIADIDEYRDAVERLRKAQAEVEGITTDIDNAGSIEEKIALEKELIGAYQEEQATLHNLNDLRDGTITAGVKTLQDLGFAVKYNADTNELWVENLEHLNELTADSTGQYGSLQEATNALRQDTEELINTITDLNEANQEGSATWWEVQRAILDAQIAVCEFEAQLHDNVLTLMENWLDNAINQKNSDDVKRYTSEMIANYKALQDVYHKQAEALRAAGYSDTTDEIVELSDAWWDLENKIKDAKDKVVDYFVELVDAANDAVNGIQNVSDVLSDAAQEYADNDGWISVDTYQSIIDLGAEYMQMLINENNELVINRDRINSIIEAKTRQLAVEQALSYVERLRLAATGASNESLDQLCFATTQATNSTWGLVYAELALMQQTGLLNGSQYQAALHNIQAIQSLAETAVAGIGQTAGAAAEKMDNLKKQLEDQKDALEDLLDELEDMKDGCDDLVQYVMDMLKDRIQQQIDALNDAKKAVKDYVDQLKEAMRAEKENVEYEDELADKLNAIAKLQSKIDALSLDDSRKAQAEKMSLEEELAELQKDLADFQADHAMDVTEDALDKQYDAYEQEKDAEIEKLEESISSTQKLYDMAIKYIKENWNTLYQELLDWNYEYGNNLNSEITAAWEAAQEAASKYGDFVTAIMGGIENDIASITAQIQSLTAQISNLSTTTSGGGGIGSVPNIVGKIDTDTTYSEDDMKQAKQKAVSDVVSQMRALSSQWHTADKATQKRLEDQALQLGATLASYGVVAHRDDPSGSWYIDNDLLNPSNAGKLLYSCYHTGGFVGEEPLKPNERYVKAENGELILTSDQQNSFAAQVDRFKTMTDAFSRSIMDIPVTTDSLWPKGFTEGGSSTSNVSTDNSRTININEGDIHVSVPVGGGRIIADEVRKITRENVNQISRMLMRP